MRPEEELRYLILRAQREGNRIFSEALQTADRTPSQAEVIRVLNDHGSLSLLELGQRLICEGGSPSRLVDGLVQAGLVDRKPAPDDRRRVELSLTRAGMAKAVKVIKAEEAICKVIRTLIPANQIPILNKALYGLIANRSPGNAMELRKSQRWADQIGYGFIKSLSTIFHITKHFPCISLFCRIWITQIVTHLKWTHLPGNSPLVLTPTALSGYAILSYCIPDTVSLLLPITLNRKQDGFIEFRPNGFLRG